MTTFKQFDAKSCQNMKSARDWRDLFDELVTEARRGEIIAKFALLPPCACAVLLERNNAFDIENRQMSRGQQKQYAADKKAARWKYAGDPIRIGRSGALLDGQHRLGSSIEADVSQEELVILGLPDDTRFVMDRTKVRRIGDYIGMRKIPNANACAAVGRLILTYGSDGEFLEKPARPTPQEILDFCCSPENQGRLAESLSRQSVPRDGIKGLGGASALIYVHYVLAAKNRTRTDQFFQRFVTGIGIMDKDDPAYVTRKRFDDESAKPRKWGERDKIVALWKGCKAFNEGRKIAQIRTTDGLPSLPLAA